MLLLLAALLFLVMVVYYSYNIATGDRTSEDIVLSCLFAALLGGALFAEGALWLDLAAIPRADRLIIELSPSLCSILILFVVMALAALFQFMLTIWLDARWERKLAGR